MKRHIWTDQERDVLRALYVDYSAAECAAGEGGCGVSELKPCPCGKTPERLIVHAEHSCPKWAWVTGSCCDGWGLEFRNDYAWQDSPEMMQKATEAWNTMERAGDEVAV